MAKRRRRDEELERETDGSGQDRLARQLADLDEGKRAGVLEELQRSSGNRALQQVVGPQLQRDVTSTQRRPVQSRHGIGRLVVALGGATVPVSSVEGGALRSEVVLERSDPTGFERKHAAGATYDPVTLEVGANAGELGRWIGKALARNAERKDLGVYHVGEAGTQGLELHDALVTSFELPALKPSSSDPVWLKVKLQPERAARSSGAEADIKASTMPEALKPSTTRLEISGIGAVGELQSLAPWTFAQKLESEFVGPARHIHTQPTSANLGNLHLTVGEGAAAEALTSWAEESMVKGNPEERTAVLTVSGTRGTKLELAFSGVGVISAELLGGSARPGRRFELFVERAALELG